MENFDEFIKQRLLSLPEEIQKAFAETDIVGEVEKIRVKNKLMYDQASVIESEVMLVFLGLERPDDLTKNISENANIPKEIVSEIVLDIEKNILKQIKSKLAETLEKEDAESSKKPEEVMDKEKILEEIENPKPLWNTIDNKEKIIEDKNTTNDKLPEIAPTQTIQKYTPPVSTKNIVEKKLTEPTHIEPKKIEISLKKIPQENPQKNSGDPYREPIN